MRVISAALLIVPLLLAAGCGTQPLAQPDAHITAPEPAKPSAIPRPVRAVPLPPPPESRPPEIRYSVVVANQNVRDVLLAMARETNINFDLHPGIEGTVTLNAIEQTLPQILTRMSKQVDLRWEAQGSTISVMPDSPYLKNYRVDYVNMARDVGGSMAVQSLVVGTSPGQGGSSANTGSATQNSSVLRVDNLARNRFWETLERNLKDLLRETDKLLPEGSSETVVQGRGTAGRVAVARRGTQPGAYPNQATAPATAAGTGAAVGAAVSDQLQGNAAQADFTESRLTFREAASVIVNAESGIVTVRASGRQHERVAEFITQVVTSAQRQVLIEATIVEVVLSDNYQSGVDWSALALDNLGYSFRQNFIGSNLANPPFFSLTYNNPNGPGGSISSTVKLLDSFGKTRVLSSPKIMSLNNQTAVLKVVDNRVYFTITAQVTPGATNANAIVAYSSTQNVVPVGFVMNVTPQIGENDIVVLNVRPTVSRIIRFVNDPNPDLARFNVQSPVPEIQSREFESVLRVPSGQTAVLGGLMQDSFEGQRDGLPIASRIPIFGDAFSFRNDTSKKSELVIFLRPIVVRDGTLEGDLSSYQRYLPSREFFKDPDSLAPQVDDALKRMEESRMNPPPPPPPGAPEAPR